MPNHQDLITQVLRYKNLSSSAIANITGISQPTVSRTLKNMPVLKLGGGRATVFALLEHENPEPLYKIDEAGTIVHIGDLYQQTESRTLLLQTKNYLTYDGLPFYFYDTIPYGFLGDIHLKKIVETDPRLTTKSQDWSDSQIIHYLTYHGDDLTGNLVLGNRMAEQVSIKDYPTVKREDYPDIAGSINRTPRNMGSSMAGEQPKFTLYNGEEHLIVKYSPRLSEDNPVAIRHRDLMICEYLALETLRDSDIPASEAYLHQDDRFYLEIKRFDRIGLHGRKGIASIKYIDAEFTGVNGSWIEIAQALFRKGIITQQNVDDIEFAHTFGKYIANTDMHNGNFSFFMEDLSLADTTPVYDMLPMAYMPVQGELRNPDLKRPRFIEASTPSKALALNKAIDFWSKVADHDLISDDFKNIANRFYHSLFGNPS